MRTINLSDKIKSIMAKKMKSKPSVSNEEQEAFNKEVEKHINRHRYSEQNIRFKSLGQKYREMSREQREKAERKSGELRKEFPSEK